MDVVLEKRKPLERETVTLLIETENQKKKKKKKKQSYQSNKRADVGYGMRETKLSIPLGEYSKLAEKEYKIKHDWLGDPLGIVQEV